MRVKKGFYDPGPKCAKCFQENLSQTGLTEYCTMEVVHEKIRRSLNIEKALNNFSLFLSKCKTYCCYKVFDFFGWKYTYIFNSVLGTHHIFVDASRVSVSCCIIDASPRCAFHIFLCVISIPSRTLQIKDYSSKGQFKSRKTHTKDIID